jgi:superoxide dismutase, Cu-Zn family
MPVNKCMVVLAASALLSCAPHAPTAPAAAVTKAHAMLHATKSGGDVNGEVTFTPTEGGILVHAEVRGLKPGKHGFHIHEFGDCSAPDASSAGGHFDPAMTKHHAAPTDPVRHGGDMGNITADAQGVATIEYTDPALSFIGPGSILGRSVIVHENEDDLKTQPTGNAGGRLACGIIGVAKGS